MSLAAGAPGAPKTRREIAREHLTWSGQRPGPTKERSARQEAPQSSPGGWGRAGTGCSSGGTGGSAQPLRAGGKKRAVVVAVASTEQKVQPRAREEEGFHVSTAQRDFRLGARCLRGVLT